MYGTWWSIVPALVAIILALITKEVYSSLFIGLLLGAMFVTGFNPWGTFETLFTTMTDSISLNIIIFDILLGMIIVLMSRSGGSAAYGNWATKKIKSKKSSLFATMGLGTIIFVDDYFNCLTVGSVMRPVTDKYNVSRAKLAYIIDATAAPICIIAPISSWAAAINSHAADSPISGFKLFLSTIPYNLYALLTLLMVALIIGFNIDFGLMGKHERNAAKGDLFTSGGEEFKSMSDEEKAANPKGKVIDLVLPVLVLIVSAIGAMIYTGFQNEGKNVADAFSNCDAEMSLIFGTMMTVIFTAILYLPRRLMSFKTFMDSLADGAKLMIPAILILTFAWTLKGLGDQLGIKEFVEGLLNSAEGSLPEWFFALIPAVVFVIALFLAFSTGTSWGTFAILVPIAISIFASVDVELMVITVSAVLAGAVCGDHISPISDTTIMSSSGAQSNHINHVQTQMQYAMIVAGVSIFGYIVAGFTKNWIISLLVSAVVLTGILLAIKKYVSKKVYE